MSLINGFAFRINDINFQIHGMKLKFILNTMNTNLNKKPLLKDKYEKHVRHPEIIYYEYILIFYKGKNPFRIKEKCIKLN